MTGKTAYTAHMKHIVSRKKAEINNGTFQTDSGCEIEVYDDKGGMWPIRLTIDANYFGVADLRALAKLANRLADVLEIQKRGL